MIGLRIMILKNSGTLLGAGVFSILLSLSRQRFCLSAQFLYTAKQLYFYA